MPPVSGATPSITPEQFRELFVQMLSDTESQRLLMRSLRLNLPVEGGMGCPTVSSISSTTDYLPKWSDTSCDLVDSAVFESSGNVGIGLSGSPPTPKNQLDVNGAVAIGASYAGSDSAPSNGLIVQGNVGIGTASPSATALVDVEGGSAYADSSHPVLQCGNYYGALGLYNDGAWHLNCINHTNGGLANFGIDVGWQTVSLAATSINLTGTVFLNGNAKVDATNYATSGDPLTTSHALELDTWAWNGSNGYTLESKNQITATQLDYNNSHARMDFKPGSTTVLSLLYTGNVGIGTASPGQPLDVVGNIRSSGQLITTATTGAPLSVASTTVVPNLNASLLNGTTWAAPGPIGGTTPNSGAFTKVTTPIILPATDSTTALQFQTGSGTPVVNVDTTNQRVGIGTTSPSQKLHVYEGTILGEVSGNGSQRNLVLNQLSGSLKRTSVSFQQEGSEQWLMGVDWNGANYPDFFLADGASPYVKRLLILKPSGGDDTTQIQHAINELQGYSPPGGIIYLSQGTYTISSTLSITNDGVKLRGYGGTWEGDGSGGGGTAAPVTLLLWTGSGGVPIISMAPASGGTPPDFVQDLEISDLTIDGGSAATIGLRLTQVMDSKFINFHVKNLVTPSTTSTGIILTTLTSSASNLADCLFNLFENCSIIGAAIGLELTSGDTRTPPQANTCHNTFIGLNVRSNGVNSTDKGIYLVACDNNTFYRTWIQMDGDYPPTPPTGYAVVVNNPVDAYSNYFYHLQPGGNTYVEDDIEMYGGGGFQINNSYPIPSPLPTMNFVFGYDQTNGEPDPSTDYNTLSPASAFVYWTNSAGQTYGSSALGLQNLATDPTTVAGAATLYSKSGQLYYREPSNGTVIGPIGAGTVTSVGLSMPGIFGVSGSPVTGSGTLSVTLDTQAANLVFAGPTSGGAAAPTFRELAVLDIPNLSASYVDLSTSQTIAGAKTFSAQPYFDLGIDFPNGDIDSSGNVSTAGYGNFASLKIGGTQVLDSSGDLVNIANITASGNFSTNGYVNADAGFRYNGSATSGHYLRGNGTDYVDSAIQDSDLPADVVTMKDGSTKKLACGYVEVGGSSSAGVNTGLSSIASVVITHEWTSTAGAAGSVSGLSGGSFTINNELATSEYYFWLAIGT